MKREASIAALLGLLESGRHRRRFVSVEEETLSSVALFSYPIYIHPWRGSAIFITPDHSMKTRLTYGATVDFHEFIGEIRRASTDRGDFTLFLTRSANVFEEFQKIETFDLGGLIQYSPISSLLIDLGKTASINPISERGVLPYSLDQLGTEHLAGSFNKMWSDIQVELDNISAVSSLLKRELERQTEKIEIEVQFIEKAAESEIAAMMPSIHQAVKKLEKSRNSELRRIEQAHRKDASTLSQAYRKLETELRHRRRQVARFEREGEKRKKRGDKYGARFWEKEKKNCLHEVSRLEKQMIKNSEEAVQLKSRLAKRLEDVQSSLEEKIRVEQQIMIIAKQQRDERVRQSKTDLLLIERLTGMITESLAKQAEQKRLELERLQNYVVPWNVDESITLSIPFYLAIYSSGRKPRYRVIPPMKIETERSGLRVATRRLIGIDNKLAGLLTPFDQRLSDLITDSLSKLLSTDAIFASEASRIAGRLNILSSDDFKRIVDDGFEELVGEGLLNRIEASKIREQVYARRHET
jgi:hypothetical protein